MTTDSKAVCGGGEADLLTFLDGLAENAAPDQRKPLNPILIGMNASAHADRIRSTALASTAGAGAGDWQPIETAPKDGRTIIVLGGRFDEPTPTQADGEWWNSTVGRSMQSRPTLWMPMPSAPCDEPPKGGDPQGSPGQSPASAVGEAEAPKSLHTHPNPKREDTPGGAA